MATVSLLVMATTLTVEVIIHIIVVTIDIPQVRKGGFKGGPPPRRQKVGKTQGKALAGLRFARQGRVSPPAFWPFNVTENVEQNTGIDRKEEKRRKITSIIPYRVWYSNKCDIAWPSSHFNKSSSF